MQPEEELPEEVWTLMVCYLSGCATEQERSTLMEWLENHPEFAHTFDEARSLWEFLADENTPPHNTSDAWATLKAKQALQESHKNTVKNQPIYWAAALALLILAVLLWTIFV